MSLVGALTMPCVVSNDDDLGKIFGQSLQPANQLGSAAKLLCEWENNKWTRRVDVLMYWSQGETIMVSRTGVIVVIIMQLICCDVYSV